MTARAKLLGQYAAKKAGGRISRLFWFTPFEFADVQALALAQGCPQREAIVRAVSSALASGETALGGQPEATPWTCDDCGRWCPSDWIGCDCKT